jgi:RimJ/RimL family protein N-acetyltransferase
MLKTVILQINKINLNHRDSLKEIEALVKFSADLEKHNVTLVGLDCNEDTMEQEIDRVFELCLIAIDDVEACLLITDMESILKKACDRKIPCVAYDNPLIEKQNLYQAPMLVEGFEEIDYRFLEEVYRRFYHLPITIGQTDRLTLREMVLEDLEELYHLYKEPEITRFLEPLYEKYEEELEFTKVYIEHMYGFYGYGLWSIIESETGKLIGRAGLNHREVDGEMQLELGYMIGVPYQRKGYAYEACKEILKFAVERLECTEINCLVDKENEASKGLIQKLGFQYRQEVFIENEKLSLYKWTYHESKGIMD